MRLKANSRIILALDVTDKKKAFNILNKVNDLIDGIKVNHPLVFSCGISICKEIKEEFDCPIIGDFKIADVPVTNRKIVEICIENKIDFLTLHGFIERASISDINDYAKGRIDIFLITELSSCIGTILFPYKEYANLAVDLNLYGVQAPATKPNVIKNVRDIVGNSKTIISCGIGAQGKKPGSAILSGADFEIIGRAIFMDKSPREATQKFKEMIMNVVK